MNIRAKLSHEDKEVFAEIADQFLEGEELKWLTGKSLGTYEEHLKSAGLKEDMASKLLDFENVVPLQTGLIVLGPEGAGKSTLVQQAFEVLKKDEPEAQLFTVGDVCVEEIYGKMTEGSFTEGLIPEYLKHQKEDSSLWIVIEKDINPIWIENLNSVLDDNRTLHLADGNRIYFNKKTKIIFNTRTADHCSPATISRCGVVTINEEDKSW